MKSIHYCYRTTNKLTGEFYIGKRTTRKHKNWFEDCYLGSGTRLNRAIEKYGEQNFYKVILCIAETKEENAENEKFFLADQWKLKECHNLKPGGEGGSAKGKDNPNYGRKLSEETKRKISKAMSGENNPFYGRKGKDNPFYGKKHSEEARKKMSKVRLAENNPNYGRIGKDNPNSIPILQLDLEGNVIREFYGAAEAARELGLDKSSITKCIKGKYKTCGSFRWKYKSL